MRYSEAVVSAVLATLLRATVDAGVPVVLRTRRAAQAHDLARWLERAHGSRRTVVLSARERGLIEVRLPARMVWPPVPSNLGRCPSALAGRDPVAHLSAMPSFPSSAGSP
jgi:hypothetical protein